MPPPEIVLCSIQSGGAALRAGENTGLAAARAKTAATLLAGSRAMLRDASSVLLGTVLPVAALNNGEQEFPPAEAVHAASASASVFSLPVGTASVEARPVPGDAPVAGFARLLAVRNALSRPVVLVQLAPTFPPPDMKEASAHTDAAVVTSSTTKELPEVMLPQGPRAVISQRDELAEAAEAG